MRIGYFLSSEEFGPRDLVDQTRRAADAGFQALWISDHFHPWMDSQGHSPFVWSTIGAISPARIRNPSSHGVRPLMTISVNPGEPRNDRAA